MSKELKLVQGKGKRDGQTTPFIFPHISTAAAVSNCLSVRKFSKSGKCQAARGR
ncbi:hypothetical protein KDW_52500 [Dictyobacter vulcani]|uniref:Uncharacterized protein n=1 Tax=Dictyobacter vulcani TaxID=2607529 RepID=A0A5J4KN44_9CHLR|nr:hypothetical protein KDW_52500 [Dictyobacter vulcani]